jgi:pimeloyl-ACP methyl ester carboxylesterase
VALAPASDEGGPDDEPACSDATGGRTRGGQWAHLDREGPRLACRDFGGRGVTTLSQHGPPGHAEEWATTARRLVSEHRVVALDARGHARSEGWPEDVSREAHPGAALGALDVCTAFDLLDRTATHFGGHFPLGGLNT